MISRCYTNVSFRISCPSIDHLHYHLYHKPNEIQCFRSRGQTLAYALRHALSRRLARYIIRWLSTAHCTYAVRTGFRQAIHMQALLCRAFDRILLARSSKHSGGTLNRCSGGLTPSTPLRLLAYRLGCPGPAGPLRLTFCVLGGYLAREMSFSAVFTIDREVSAHLVNLSAN
jgi:hypothetical protein